MIELSLSIRGVGQGRKAVFLSGVTTQRYRNLSKLIEPKNRNSNIITRRLLGKIVLQKSPGYTVRGNGHRLVGTMAVNGDYLIARIQPVFVSRRTNRYRSDVKAAIVLNCIGA